MTDSLRCGDLSDLFRAVVPLNWHGFDQVWGGFANKAKRVSTNFGVDDASLGLLRPNSQRPWHLEYFRPAWENVGLNLSVRPSRGSVFQVAGQRFAQSCMCV